MRPATVQKWLQENANAPPPPATPAGLPDDSASTVYPESSVSNPYASRYTGSRHRTLAVARAPQHNPYLERRPSTSMGHNRDHHHQQAVTVVPTRPARSRYNSFSAESRYVPTKQAQVYTYAQTQPQASQMYFAPGATQHAGHGGYSRGHRTHQSSQYQVVSNGSPKRVEVATSRDARQYTTYNTYASTPTVSLHSRSAPTKKAPLLRRLFGIDWGHSAPKSSNKASRYSSSRSSAKSKSLERETTYRPARPRTRSEERVVLVRY